MTNELVVSRVFPASRDLVFRAWSSAEHVRHWFSPEGYSVPEAEIDFRVGGVFNVCMQSLDGQRHWTRGRFAEIVAHARVVIDLQAVGDNDPPLFRAFTTVSFAQQPGGATRMEVKQTYTVFDQLAAGMIGGARVGWGQTLDKLEREVARIKAQPPVARSVSFGTFCIERTWQVSRAQVFRALTNPDA